MPRHFAPPPDFLQGEMDPKPPGKRGRGVPHGLVIESRPTAEKCTADRACDRPRRGEQTPPADPRPKLPKVQRSRWGTNSSVGGHQIIPESGRAVCNPLSSAQKAFLLLDNPGTRGANYHNIVVGAQRASTWGGDGRRAQVQRFFPPEKRFLKRLGKGARSPNAHEVEPCPPADQNLSRAERRSVDLEPGSLPQGQERHASNTAALFQHLLCISSLAGGGNWRCVHQSAPLALGVGVCPPIAGDSLLAGAGGPRPHPG